ncbi:MAG TPA: tetratricopeptide repeat protein [Burkholderiaceae bacterium]
MPNFVRTSLSLLALLISASALAAPLDEAQALWHAGKREQALALAEKAIAQDPQNARLRFALGVMRMEAGDLTAAAKLFTALTQDFPDLADPYNNLAVIHAGRGELDAAAVALEQSVRLQPDNALAQENRGDVLMRLALRAYEHAARQPSGSTPQLELKLKRTRELIAPTSPSPTKP